jgi:hypothetical protein
VHEIERVVGQAGRGGVRLDELDRQAMLLGESPPRVHHLCFSVQTNHPSVGTNPLGKQVGDAEDAAADVDRGAAGTDADQVKQLRRLLRVDLGLLDQVANLCRAVAKQIPP